MVVRGASHCLSDLPVLFLGESCRTAVTPFGYTLHRARYSRLHTGILVMKYHVQYRFAPLLTIS